MSNILHFKTEGKSVKQTLKSIFFYVYVIIQTTFFTIGIKYKNSTLFVVGLVFFIPGAALACPVKLI